MLNNLKLPSRNNMFYSEEDFFLENECAIEKSHIQTLF